VDTGAFLALRNRSEKEHHLARRTLAELVAAGVQLFTSNYVFSETYTGLVVRVSRAEAVRWGAAMRGSDAIEVVRVDEATEDEAWSILESQADKLYSYVDATSFALMVREGTSEAFAFDRHFKQRGLQVLPASARQQ